MPNQIVHMEQDIQQKIFADRVILLNQNLLLSIPANLLCSLLVFGGLMGVVNPTGLLWWLITALCAFTLHCGMFYINRYSHIPSKLLLNLLISLTIIYGSLWGIAGSMLIPNHDLLHQMLVIIIIIGVASAGLHILQASTTASILFFILTILPLSTWFFFQGNLTYCLLGVAFLIYFCFMLMVSWLGYKLLNNNFKLRYENLHLINQLSVNNAVLEESESRFRAAFDFAAIGMALVSLEGRWLKVNKVLCHIVGYTEEELLRIDFQTITYPADLELDLNYVQQLLAGKISTYHMEKRYIHKNGGIIWILLSGSLIRDAENEPLYFIGQIQNIDAQKKAEQELKYIAFHDVLTGLANRKQLELSFDFALTYAKRHHTQIAILFMDLDYFKQINDNYGHDVGDFLLTETARRLKVSLRSIDIIVRLGGDEFIVVLTELIDVEQVPNITKKILSSIAKPMTIKYHDISITGSIGISLYPDDGHDLITLMKLADEALYRVKSEGRNNFQFFAD